MKLVLCISVGVLNGFHWFLDFNHALNKIINKTCRLIYSVILNNYSHEYKTRRIFELWIELSEEQNTTSDTYTEDKEDLKSTESLQIHSTYNTTMHDKDDLIHDEYDTSEDENITQTETFEHNGEKIHETEESIPAETSQVLTVFNKAIIMKMIHQMTYLRLKLNHQKRMGSKKLENRTNSLLPHFKLKLKTKKCSVRYILKATARSLESVLLKHFLFD